MTATSTSVTGNGWATVSVLLASGGGAFEPAVSYPVNSAADVAVGDISGDGRPDLGCACSGFVHVLLGNGDGTFAARTDYSINGNPISIALADFNGDGRLDAVAANQSSSTASVLLGRGDGTFIPRTDYATGERAGRRCRRRFQWRRRD